MNKGSVGAAYCLKDQGGFLRDLLELASKARTVGRIADAAILMGLARVIVSEESWDEIPALM